MVERLGAIGQRIARVEVEPIPLAVARFHLREQVADREFHGATMTANNNPTPQNLDAADKAYQRYLGFHAQAVKGFPQDRHLVLFDRIRVGLSPKIGR